MTVLAIGLGEYSRIIHPGLILQGHELHWVSFLRGDDLLGRQPAGERHILSNVQGQVFGQNARLFLYAS